MAIAAMRVPTVFTAIDRFSNVVSQMTSGVSKFSKTSSSAISRVDNRINGMWGSMNGISQLAVGGGFGSLFYYAGKDIMDYEAKIASLAAVTGTQIGSMNNYIESLGKETKRSVIDIAGSFEIVGSKMERYLKNPEALKQITRESILLAEASRMKLEPAIEALTGVMNIYGLSAEKANYVVNKLSAGEVVGSIKIPETLDLLRQFGGTARLANVQVDESIALIQALTKSLGVEGVGRGIRNLMIDLNMVGAFDKKKQKALEMAGVNFKVLADKSLPLIDRLKELKKLEGNSAAMGMFFKKTGIQVGSTLFQNFDDLIKFLNIIKSTNPAVEQASKNNSTLSYSIDRLKDKFTNFVTTDDNANSSLRITKSLIRLIADNMGFLLNVVFLLSAIFIIWKAVVLASAIRLFVLNIAMGISAFRAGAMAIAMEGNAVAIGTYNLATLIATGSTATLGVSMMTVLWPILLILGAIGLLTYAYSKNSDSTETLANKQISALGENNKAWINSTGIMSSEMKKQQALLDNPPKVKQLPKPAASKELDKMNSILKTEEIRQKSMAKIGYGRDMSGNKLLPALSDSQSKMLNQLVEMNTTLGVEKANVLRSNGFTFEEFKKVYPNSENKKEKGEITIYLKSSDVDIFDFQSSGDYKIIPKGIPVLNRPNQGTR
jgi:TP901 family phage tail tape measure protein